MCPSSEENKLQVHKDCHYMTKKITTLWLYEAKSMKCIQTSQAKHMHFSINFDPHLFWVPWIPWPWRKLPPRNPNGDQKHPASPGDQVAIGAIWKTTRDVAEAVRQFGSRPRGWFWKLNLKVIPRLVDTRYIYLDLPVWVPNGCWRGVNSPSLRVKNCTPWNVLVYSSIIPYRHPIILSDDEQGVSNHLRNAWYLGSITILI